MRNLFATLVHDEAGFIVSAELVLIATIAVIGLVVGLTEVSTAVNTELDDVASAIGSLNQSYCYNGLRGCKGSTAGSCYNDKVDQCDQVGISCNNPPTAEDSVGHGYGY